MAEQREIRDQRERDILLAGNEFCYVQDMTKGDVVLYVGPAKISMSNTERLVNIDSKTRKVMPVGLADEQAMHNFVFAADSEYIVLENPTTSPDAKYSRGINAAQELNYGEKVVVPGPKTFPLWPGQTAKVISGHKLREDEYLLIRAYNNTTMNDTAIPTGTEMIIKGSEKSFYMPTIGLEVVPQDDGNFVRKAVKLMAGEYCVLLEPNGEKKYIVGPNQVIPAPNETLLEKVVSGISRAIFQAQTLKPERGLHLYVTKDFKVEENDPLSNIIGAGPFKIGQELFVEGKDGLFFPNENIELRGEISPISLAESEGLYVRNLNTGEIKTIKGPKNVLPNPIKESIVERSLDKTVEVLYGVVNRDKGKAVSVYVPPNHATMIVSEKERKVVQGPERCILDYSESLEKLTFSTGTPKSDKLLLETVFLQQEGNKVSDVVTVETKEHIQLDVKVSYRISFEGEPKKWFDVSDYVGLLCEHLSSIMRSAVKKISLSEFYPNSIDLVRDAILGVKKEGEQRTGRFFKENGMRVYDLEVLNVAVLNDELADLLTEAEQSAFRLNLSNERMALAFNEVKLQREQELAMKGLDLDLKGQLLEKELGSKKQGFAVSQQIREMNMDDKVNEIEMATHLKQKEREQKEQEIEINKQLKQLELGQKEQETEITKKLEQQGYTLTELTQKIQQDTNKLRMITEETALAAFEREKDVKIAAVELGNLVCKMQEVGKAEAFAEAKKIEVAAKGVEYAVNEEVARKEHERKVVLIQEEAAAYAQRMGAWSEEISDLAAAAARLGDQKLFSELAQHVGQLGTVEGENIQELLRSALQNTLPVVTKYLSNALVDRSLGKP